MRHAWQILGVFILLGLLQPLEVCAQVTEEKIQDLEKIGIDEKIGTQLPLDLVFTDSEGRQARLGDYFESGKPTLINLVYFECPMLCTLVLNGVVEAIQGQKLELGKDFQMITVSIDPTEGADLALVKKKSYLEVLGERADASGWHFLVGEADQVKALADSLGFRYFYDEEIREFAHAAATFVTEADGTIARYLYGTNYRPNDLKLALLEGSKGSLGDTLDKVLLYCYRYDPDSRGYVLFAENLMRVGGGLTMAVLVVLLGGLWRREKVRARVDKNEESRA